MGQGLLSCWNNFVEWGIYNESNNPDTINTCRQIPDFRNCYGSRRILHSPSSHIWKNGIWMFVLLSYLSNILFGVQPKDPEKSYGIIYSTSIDTMKIKKAFLTGT